MPPRQPPIPKSLKHRGPEMPFPAFKPAADVTYIYRGSINVFSHVSGMNFNSINIILPFCYHYFLFNVAFLGEPLWFYFTIKLAGIHVHNSWGKSRPRPLVTALAIG